MGRSPSNKGLSKNNFNGSALSTGRNPGGMVAGLTAGTTYGTGKDIKEQVAATGGLPKTARESTLRQAQQEGMQRRGMKPPAIDVFAGTQIEAEPVSAGLPFGEGAGPEPGTSYEMNQFIFNSWIESGDDSLLQYLI
jgi:hypothetical protein